MTVRVRLATGGDRDAVRAVHLGAFPDGEGLPVAQLAARLLDERTDPDTFGLVAEVDGALAGHVAFSPLAIDTDARWVGYILAPLGVMPAHQRRGIGSTLVRSGVRRLSQGAVDMLFVYGDPEYYGRFGFEAAITAGLVPPYPLEHPFGWQALALREERSGARAGRLSCVASLRDPALW